MADSIFLDIGSSIRTAEGNTYEIVQFLGRGGNAVTYLVLSTDGRLKGLLFALKLFFKLSKPERRTRFLEEIKFLKTCDHAAIMRVFDDGLHHSGDSEFPFVVMEYLPYTLRQVMKKSLPIPERLAYAVQLNSALAFLERQTPIILHRDIKPENIMIKGQSCVLGDFGLMKLGSTASDEQDREVYKESLGPGMPLGYRTPDLVAYANNQCDLSDKTDVFQLGLVLAELFTNRNPCRHSGDPLAPVELEKLSNVPCGLNRTIQGLLRLMLTMNPDDRPRSSSLLDKWQSLFSEAVLASHKLTGRVF